MNLGGEEMFALSSKDDFPKIETLVLRPSPRLPRKSGDDPNLCAYVNLRTTVGRRKTVENIMETFKTLTRLVLVVHGYDYEIRRDLKTGIIAEEELITLDKQEWALVFFWLMYRHCAECWCTLQIYPPVTTSNGET